MKALLKDMPDHAETVETSYSFKSDIYNLVNVENYDELMEIIKEFVNQNYTQNI